MYVCTGTECKYKYIIEITGTSTNVYLKYKHPCMYIIDHTYAGGVINYHYKMTCNYP